MTDKVILTKVQAEAIEELKTEYQGGDAVSIHVKHKWELGLQSLNTLTVDEFAQAYYSEDGYEVEPEYPKEGDWVKCDTGSAVIYGQIDTTAFDDVIGNFSNGQRQRFHKKAVSFMLPSEIAEEKERRFFARNGREPWELRLGDVLVHDKGGVFEYGYNPKSKNGLHIVYEVSINGGKRKSKLSMQYIKNLCKVVCFVEKRLDLKTNEQ